MSSNGLLSLLNIMNNSGKGKGAVSNKEFQYFMDKDTGTEHHTRNLGAVSDKEMDAYGNPIPDIDVNELTKKFSEILGSISPQEQLPVIKHWQHSDDDGKVWFMKHIVDNPELATGYGIQDEILIPNLGF